MNFLVVRLFFFLFVKMDNSLVVSFKVKGDSNPLIDEDQWQETVLIDDDNNKF